MRSNHDRGIILLVILWVMVILTILGTSFFHLTSIEVQTSRNELAKYQARLLAEASLELAYAVLKEKPNHEMIDLAGDWSGSGKLFEKGTLGEGLFQIYTDDVYSEEGGTRYGLRDESSKLNLNTATLESLNKLPNMTRALAGSLVDWIDADDVVSPGGAENDYYQNLENPLDCRNGPMQTLQEILQIKGFQPRVLFGEDANLDGVLQAAEDDGGENPPPDNNDGKLDRGIYPYVTIYSYDLNVNGEGEKRLNLQKASLEDFEKRFGDKVPSQKWKAIIEHREKVPFKSVTELLSLESDASPPKEQNETRRERGSRRGRNAEEEQSASSEEANRGETEVPRGLLRGKAKNSFLTARQFMEVMNDLTLVDDEKIQGTVNLNTAPREVLVCLPGMTENLADNILAKRGSELGSFNTVLDLASVEGMNLEVLGKLLPVVTVRSMVFEAISVGYLPDKNAYSQIHAVIDRGGKGSRYRYYRILR